MPHPRVVHLKHSPYDLRIDRATKWGNPFRIGRDGTREDVLDKYAEWVTANSKLLRAIERGELDGKVLGCWCAPKPCHGEILVALDERREPGEFLVHPPRR